MTLDPKTEAGARDIPMTASVREAFEKQREYQFMMGIDRDYAVDGMKSFIFTSKNGRPMQPSAVNDVLYNIVDAYNKQEASTMEVYNHITEYARIEKEILKMEDLMAI